MPAHGLARLIERLHPGVPVRELARRADLPVDRIAHYLKPGTEYTRLPPPGTIRDVAQMLGCPVVVVVHAFNDSLDEPLPLNELPEDEALLTARFRALSGREQRTLLAIAQTLVATADDPPKRDIVLPADMRIVSG